MLGVFKNIITYRTSQSVEAGIRAFIFNRCNDATVRFREVVLVCATLLYHVHAVASRNKWFTSCGTSQKLTLWTPLVCKGDNELPGSLKSQLVNSNMNIRNIINVQKSDIQSFSKVC